MTLSTGSGHVRQRRRDRVSEHGDQARDVAALAHRVRDHRVDQHHEQRAGGEPVDARVEVPADIAGDRPSEHRRRGTDERDQQPQPADRRRLRARGAHLARGADRLRQVGDEDRHKQPDAHAPAGRDADAEHHLLGNAVQKRAQRQRGPAGPLLMARPPHQPVRREVRRGADGKPEPHVAGIADLRSLFPEVERHRADQRAGAEREHHPDRAVRPRPRQPQERAQHERRRGKRATSESRSHERGFYSSGRTTSEASPLSHGVQGDSGVGRYWRSHTCSVYVRGTATTPTEPLRTTLAAPIAWFHVNRSRYPTLARDPVTSRQLRPSVSKPWPANAAGRKSARGPRCERPSTCCSSKNASNASPAGAFTPGSVARTITPVLASKCRTAPMTESCGGADVATTRRCCECVQRLPSRPVPCHFTYPQATPARAARTCQVVLTFRSLRGPPRPRGVTVEAPFTETPRGGFSVARRSRGRSQPSSPSARYSVDTITAGRPATSPVVFA